MNEIDRMWQHIMDMCARNGQACISTHVARELWDASGAGVDVARLRDRVGALEQMLAAALRRAEEVGHYQEQILRLQKAVARLHEAYDGEYEHFGVSMDDDTADWLGLHPDDVPPERYHELSTDRHGPHSPPANPVE